MAVQTMTQTWLHRQWLTHDYSHHSHKNQPYIHYYQPWVGSNDCGVSLLMIGGSTAVLLNATSCLRTLSFRFPLSPPDCALLASLIDGKLLDAWFKVVTLDWYELWLVALWGGVPSASVNPVCIVITGIPFTNSLLLDADAIDMPPSCLFWPWH